MKYAQAVIEARAAWEDLGRKNAALESREAKMREGMKGGEDLRRLYSGAEYVRLCNEYDTAFFRFRVASNRLANVWRFGVFLTDETEV